MESTVRRLCHFTFNCRIERVNYERDPVVVKQQLWFCYVMSTSETH